MEFNWKISAMECIITDGVMSNVVQTVHWRYNAKESIEDKVYFAELYGATKVGEPTPEDFTDYNSLTKEQVVSWLEAELDVPEMQKNLENQINLQINPVDEILPPPFND